MSHPSAQDWQDCGHCFSFQGHQLFACRDGTGSDLLLIHGFPTSSYDWALIWPELATRHRLHAIDMLGFGLSDKPSQYAYSIDASADQWVAYVQAQGLREVDVLAMTMAIPCCKNFWRGRSRAGCRSGSAVHAC